MNIHTSENVRSEIAMILLRKKTFLSFKYHTISIAILHNDMNFTVV